MSKNFSGNNNNAENSLKESYFNQQAVLGGCNSFDADSLPDYSEFDSESVTLDYFKERLAVYFIYVLNNPGIFFIFEI